MYCGSKKEKIISNPGIEEKGIPRLKVKARGQRRATRERSEFQTRKQAADAGSLSAVNASSNPRRISAAVQNRTDTNYVTFYAVINRKGKAFTQAATISKNFGMNATVDNQCVNVPENGFAKIASETGSLVFIESKPGD